MASLDLAGIITRVCTDLKAKFAPLSHSHGIEDLPTGTTATTVALGNHTHSGYASSSHSHGSISNGGAITSDTTAASGDKLLITDSSDSSKIKRSGIAFGSSTSTFLRNDGAWAEAGSGLPSVSASDNGKVLRVVNGAWSAASLPSASGVSF